MATIGELRQAAKPRREVGIGGTSIEDMRAAARGLSEREIPGKMTLFPGGPELPELMRPVGNFFEGFNQRLAHLVAAPVEIVNEALNLAGAELLEKPGNAVKAVTEAFESVGIGATPLEGFSKELGRNTFDATLTLAALFAVAPTLVAQAASRSPGLTTRVGAELGNLVLRRPGLAVAADIGATAGATKGEEIGGGVGAVGGALLGGVATAGVVPAVRFGLKAIPTVLAGGTGAIVGSPAGLPGATVGALIAGKAAVSARRGVTKGFGRIFGARPVEKPILQEVTPGTTRAVVGEVLDRRLLETESEIGGILARLPQQSAEGASVDLRVGLNKALTTARGLESSLYTNQFLAKTTGADPLVRAARLMRGNTAERSPASPTAELDRIGIEFTKTAGKKGAKKKVGRRVSGLKLQQFGSDILDAQRAARSGPAPNRRLARNLGILKDGVDSALAQIDRQAVDTARSVSNRLNKFFFKGPIGRVMRQTRVGEPTIPEELTVQTLLRRPAGFRQIPLIASQFSVKELEPLVRQAIRAEFRVAAEQSGKDATKFLKANESAIKSFGDEFIQLQTVATDLVQLEARRGALQKGVLARFAERDPQIAFNRLHSAKDPAAEARDIVTTLEDTPTDLLAFQNEFLADLFRRSGYLAQNLKSMLAQPKTERLVESILSNENLGRLTRVVEVAANVESGRMSVAGVRQPVLGTFMDLVGRFTGAGVGRRLGSVTGGTTIQQTGATASFTKNIFLAMTGRIPPDRAFARAITDPEFERLMMQKVPQTDAEIKEFRNAVRHFISIKTALIRFVSEEAEEGDGRERGFVTAPEATQVPEQVETLPVVSGVPIDEEEEGDLDIQL